MLWLFHMTALRLMSTCHHVNEPPEISNKGSIKKDKSELFVWAPDLAPALISNYFPSVLVTAIGGATPRCPSVACPTLSPVTLTPVYPALGCDTALLRAEKLSLLSVSRCYRWGEDVTRSALGNHQPKFQRINKELNLVQRVFFGIGDKCFYLERNLKKINVEMKSFVCPHVRLSCCLSVGFNF